MDFITKLQIDWWSFTRNISKLSICLESSSYKVRRLAASKLGQLKDITAIPFLKQKLDDPVLKVAETALYAIEVIAKENCYPIDLHEQKRLLKERKKDIFVQQRLSSFKFEKETWIHMHRKGDTNHIPAWLRF